MNWNAVVVILLIVVVGIYLFFDVYKKTGKQELDFSASKEDGIRWKMSSEPEKNVHDAMFPTGSEFPREAKPKLARDDNLVNVAVGKPVVYIGQQLLLEGNKLWDRDGYYERYSVNTGRYPSNLTDGNPQTMAYPAHWFFDYIVDMEKPYEIKVVNLVWGSFGKSDKHIYINSWQLFYQEELTGDKKLDAEHWKPLASGKIPDEIETAVLVDKKVRRFRIRAQSIDEEKHSLYNWIGIHEFQAYAKPQE